MPGSCALWVHSTVLLVPRLLKNRFSSSTWKTVLKITGSTVAILIVIYPYVGSIVRLPFPYSIISSRQLSRGASSKILGCHTQLSFPSSVTSNSSEQLVHVAILDRSLLTQLVGINATPLEKMQGRSLPSSFSSSASRSSPLASSSLSSLSSSPSLVVLSSSSS